MSETVKLIIEMPKEIYESRYGDECDEKDCLIIDTFTHAIANGTPLDDVKSKIEDCSFDHYFEYGEYIGENPIQHRICMTDKVLDILDNIGKGDKE